MKLAESWIEDAPSLATVEAFHDEAEEHDEVKEAEDGCGVAVVCAKKASHQQQIAA